MSERERDTQDPCTQIMQQAQQPFVLLYPNRVHNFENLNRTISQLKSI